MHNRETHNTVSTWWSVHWNVHIPFHLSVCQNICVIFIRCIFVIHMTYDSLSMLDMQHIKTVTCVVKTGRRFLWAGDVLGHELFLKEQFTSKSIHFLSFAPNLYGFCEALMLKMIWNLQTRHELWRTEKFVFVYIKLSYGFRRYLFSTFHFFEAFRGLKKHMTEE